MAPDVPFMTSFVLFIKKGVVVKIKYIYSWSLN